MDVQRLMALITLLALFAWMQKKTKKPRELFYAIAFAGLITIACAAIYIRDIKEVNDKKETLPVFAGNTANKSSLAALPDEVIAGGNTVGVRVEFQGALVVGFDEIFGNSGDKSTSPAKQKGLRKGDVIVAINDAQVNQTKDLSDIIHNCGGAELHLKARRGSDTVEFAVCPSFSATDNCYRIGALVKDSAAGIGTVTFYDPATGKFAALGHGVTDIDTGRIAPVNGGEILPTTVVGIEKGEKGKPGQLKGIFYETGSLGDIDCNNEYGIWGKLNQENIPNSDKTIKPAPASSVSSGAAQILCNISGNEVRAFDIVIQKVLPSARDTNRSLIVKVTDPELLSKTGGIVQGMSGCPIIQNGMLAGAITHVFVNDPTRGYGTLIEHMLENVNTSGSVAYKL